MGNLPGSISSLSPAEKFDLIDALWEDLAARAPQLTQEQSAELDGRIARYEQDPSNVIAWERVKADLFKQQ